jgi:DNA-binding CsgD family transcriptional regulator
MGPVTATTAAPHTRGSEVPGAALNGPHGLALVQARAITPNPLRGRERELATLHGQLDRLRSGISTCWLIQGGSGIGKTRLVEQAALAAREAGFGVGNGAADPGDAAVPLAPLMEALFDGPVPLLDRSALSESHTSAGQGYWLLQDIQSLLEQAALRRPILICLDDVQWADGATIAAIRNLPARLASLPVGWMLAFRPPRPDSDLRRAAASLTRGGADVTSLSGLEPPAVAEVAADILGAAPEDALLAMSGGTQGNPFRLIELLSGLRDDHLVIIREGQACLAEPRLPSRVRTGMRRRLSEMSPAARDVAAVAASMGRRFTVAQLASVLDAPPSSLLAPVAELIGGELLAEGDQTLAFTHDLNREAVRASLPSSAVQALDRQVASTLLACGALPVEVATRLAASAERGDEVAIATLAKAADALTGVDPTHGADLARRALDLTTDGHPLRGPLVARVALLLHAAARSEEAIAFADSALHQALPPQQEAEVQLSIASLFSISPELRAQACRRALSLPALPPDLRARLLAQLFYNLVVAVRPDQAARELPAASEAVKRTQDGTARFTLELAEAALHFIRGQVETALALADASLRSSSGAADPRRWLARHFRSGILVVMDRFEEARAAVNEGIRAAQQAHQERALQLFEGNQARQQLQLGQLADAAATLEGRFSPDDARLVVSVLDADAVVVLGRIAIHTANRRQAELTSAVARVMLGSGIPGVQRHAAWLLALQAQAAGDPGQARSWLSALGETERLSIVPLFPFDPADDPQLVRMAMACGDRKLAESAVAAAERRSDINPGMPALLASAAHVRGLLDGDRDQLARAVAILESGPRRLFLASALEDLAGAEAGAGRTGQAVAAFDRALAIYAACGASADLGRVRRKLRDLGVTRRLASGRRPARGWEALTDSERTVVRLVADGLTNREVAERLYVSPHTVSGHLRHAFEKLEISSRVTLSRIVSEHRETF